MSIFSRREEESGLLSLESVTLLYMLVTAVMVLAYWDGLSAPLSMLGWRAGVLAYMALSNLLYHAWPSRLAMLLRGFPLIALLAQWYPETYEFCKQLNYQDHVFAAIDYRIFGCQPALVFDRWLASTFWSEAFCLGYYAYYYMMAAMALFYFFARYADFQRAMFVFLASFFAFYLIFEFLPVAGPQYYYCALGTDAAGSGDFPPMGHYFATHTDALSIAPKGVFSRLVLAAQEAGEHPTAAFPSSHVGMSTVTMLLVWQTRNRWLFWAMAPLFVLLCFATVYIKAHYAIDSLAGLAAGFLFFAAANRAYPWARHALRLKP